MPRTKMIVARVAAVATAIAAPAIMWHEPVMDAWSVYGKVALFVGIAGGLLIAVWSAERMMDDADARSAKTSQDAEATEAAPQTSNPPPH
jgi:hypothetical protein